MVTRHLDDGYDEDTDICPVCDGDCICRNDSSSLSHGIHSPRNDKLLSTTSTLLSKSVDRPTLPRSFLRKRRASPSVSVNSDKPRLIDRADIASQSPLSSDQDAACSPASVSKCRRRPCKALGDVRRATNHPYDQVSSRSIRQIQTSVSPSSLGKIQPKSVSLRLPTEVQNKSSTIKKPIKRRRILARDPSSNKDYCSQCVDAHSPRFPTFVSPSAVSSSSSDLDSISLNHFDSDSSEGSTDECCIMTEPSNARDNPGARNPDDPRMTYSSAMKRRSLGTTEELEESSRETERHSADIAHVRIPSGLIPQFQAQLNTSVVNTSFEVTESWDGQIMFTNGLQEGDWTLDRDFELSAARMGAESPSPNGLSMDELPMDTGVINRCVSPLVEDDGATTDDDLLGDDGLPNERAMQLFVLPLTMATISPISTAGRSHLASPDFALRMRNTPNSCISQHFADVLLNAPAPEGSSPDEDVFNTQKYDKPSHVGFPRTGIFRVATSDHHVVVNESRRDSRPGYAQPVHFDASWLSGSFSNQSPAPSSYSGHLGSDDSTESMNLDDVLTSSYLDTCGPSMIVI